MPALSDALSISNLRLRNRLALPPLTTNTGNLQGEVTPMTLDFYRKRSRHVGLVIVEATAVRPDGRIVPGSLGLWDNNQVPGMARLAEIIKAEGAAAIVQINHAGARCIPGGGELAGASPAGFPFRPDVQPLVLTEERIRELAGDYAAAASRAMEAGFDGVEIHGAHFYLISQFLSPLTNHRDDRYGGDLAGRATFALEVIEAVRERVGPGRALLFRFNSLERVEGGQTLEDAAALSRLLAEAGVDILDVSLIPGSNWREANGKRYLATFSSFQKHDPPGGNIENTAVIRKESGLPVIVVGKMGDERAIFEALQGPKADIIALGRQMIADPSSAEKILDGRFQDIIPCKECMACFSSLGRGERMRCSLEE